MTTFDYTRAAAAASRLLKRFGRTGYIRRSTVAGGDAWNPGSGVTTTTDHAATVVVLDYDTREIDGTLVQADDRKVLTSIEGLSIAPAVSDRLVIGSDVFEIARVKPLSPGGTTVLWEIQARRA